MFIKSSRATERWGGEEERERGEGREGDAIRPG